MANCDIIEQEGLERDENLYGQSQAIERQRQAAVRRVLEKQTEKLALAEVAATLIAGTREVLETPEMQEFEKLGAFNVRIQRRREEIALRAVEMAAALIDSADFYLGQGLEAEGPETPVGKTPQRECMAVLRIHDSGEANKPAGNGERPDVRDINILQTL
jgi:hypothetical protein